MQIMANKTIQNIHYRLEKEYGDRVDRPCWTKSNKKFLQAFSQPIFRLMPSSHELDFLQSYFFKITGFPQMGKIGENKIPGLEKSGNFLTAQNFR